MQELLPLYLLSFISGILTTLQPCIFPLMPTYLSYMTNSKKSSKQGIISSFYLINGIMVVFLAIALLIKSGQVWLGLFLNTHVVEFNVY